MLAVIIDSIYPTVSVGYTIYAVIYCEQDLRSGYFYGTVI